jgi:membrane protease YdiL (CAAX protease family)
LDSVSAPPPSLDRDRFLRIAIPFEAGLVPLAVGLAWLFGISLPNHLGRPGFGLWWGVLATIPPLVCLVVVRAIPWPPLRRVGSFLNEVLGPALAQCSLGELALVASLAGVGEELLFRGALQPVLGLALTSLIFAGAHFITPTYAVLTGLMGLYLGWLFTASQTLWVPIVTHALYDFVAFLVVIRDVRRQARDS